MRSLHTASPLMITFRSCQKKTNREDKGSEEVVNKAKNRLSQGKDSFS